jgi:hypothetical protein
MCEPNHSITQFPPEDPKGPPGGNEVTEQRLRFGLKGLWDYLKKIGGFFHLSRMGSGHSESIEWASTNGWFLPKDTRYEARWWDRTVVLDGRYHGPVEFKDEAVTCATTYAQQVSIGNLTTLRRFLESSLRVTGNIAGYVSHFVQGLIVTKHRDLVANKIGSLLQCSYSKATRFFIERKAKDKLDSLIKLLLGLTRKREILHPAWADDGSLWV